MKKIIAYVLVAMMAISTLAACGGNEKNEDLQAAVDYIYAMYKDAGTSTAKDFERTAQVMVGSTKYAVEWTVNTDKVKVTVDGAVAKFDVDEKSEEEVAYEVTATVKDEKGNTASKTFKYTVPKFDGYGAIVKEAYKLEAGAKMDGACTLEGVITKIDTAWADNYKNITVTIQVGDLKDMPIMCYRLQATDKNNADENAKVAGLAVGDKITVTGTIKNYNGIIEFDAGCTLDALTKGEGSAEKPAGPTNLDVPANATATQIVELAFKLENGAKLTSNVTLTGVITKLGDINEKYGDRNVNFTVEGKDIYIYALKGDVANLKEGDTITVTGLIKNYNGTIEFDKPQLDAVK